MFRDSSLQSVLNLCEYHYEKRSVVSLGAFPCGVKMKRPFLATMPILAATALLCVSGLAFHSAPQTSPAPPKLAATPPMGWNSWDSFGTAVTEDEVKANADYMAKNLVPFGWKYIVVDIQWYAPTAKGHNYIPGAKLEMDSYGRLIPAVNRFPSAANGAGFKPLADYVHSKGLLFGIHIMRGIPKEAVTKVLPIKGTPYDAANIADPDNLCVWNPDMMGVDTTKPGAQSYYDSLAELYASWGVDFIKADDMASHLYQPAEIRALSLAIHKSGRPMVLSLSPGPAPISEVAFFRKFAQMWRISDDFWDSWPSLKEQFARAAAWAPLSRPGAWPDADMLPLGKIGDPDDRGSRRWTNFTHDEQVTLMTLWSMMRSPLIFGGALPANDAFTLSLLTNPEVIEVDQRSSGNHQAYESASMIAWVADAPNAKDKYVALFNLSDKEQNVSVAFSELKVPVAKASMRDLWEHKDLGSADHTSAQLPAHGAALFRATAN
jgi:alpha-galactosidase